MIFSSGYLAADLSLLCRPDSASVRGPTRPKNIMGSSTARVARDAHAEFLLACGADEVIYPEKQMGEWAAVRYGSEHVFDYVHLSHDHSIYETDIPESWAGHTPAELAVRQKYGLNILAIRKDGEVVPMPGASYAFSRGERAILLGSDSDVKKFLKF